MNLIILTKVWPKPHPIYSIMNSKHLKWAYYNASKLVSIFIYV